MTEFEFEEELRVRLGRVEAPVGLVDAVMGRVATKPVRVVAFRPRRAWIGALAASLLLGAMLVGGVEHQRNVARSKAERDFARSIEITERALAHTRQQIQHAGVVLED